VIISIQRADGILLFRQFDLHSLSPQMPDLPVATGLAATSARAFLQVLTDQSFAASEATLALLVRAPNCPSLLTKMPATQAFGAQKESCALPTLMAAIAIDVMSRLIVEKQET
jgi:hypothetical protein